MTSKQQWVMSLKTGDAARVISGEEIDGEAGEQKYEKRWRIVCVVEYPYQLKNCFRYELAPKPPLLFDSITLNKSIKSSLVSDLNVKNTTRRYQSNVYMFWMGVTFCILLYGPDQHSQENMVTTTTKDKLLDNRENKISLINALTALCIEFNFKVYQAEADANITIVNVALDRAKCDVPVVVGQDTDILVLLTQLSTASDDMWFLRPASGNKKPQS
ncbi:unnamed protein product [Timema podura]|uniref:Uncharacterized protein n=1 Tax=Timema podura TaxID=61482 RepID=A0ABN7NFP3_TIMPD|nr:unnamed protein product [Timema podura]